MSCALKLMYLSITTRENTGTSLAETCYEVYMRRRDKSLNGYACSVDLSLNITISIAKYFLESIGWYLHIVD